MFIDDKIIEPYRCQYCGDDYYTKYKDFENICFVCGIKLERN